MRIQSIRPEMVHQDENLKTNPLPLSEGRGDTLQACKAGESSCIWSFLSSIGRCLAWHFVQLAWLIQGCPKAKPKKGEIQTISGAVWLKTLKNDPNQLQRAFASHPVAFEQVINTALQGKNRTHLAAIIREQGSKALDNMQSNRVFDAVIHSFAKQKDVGRHESDPFMPEEFLHHLPNLWDRENADLSQSEMESIQAEIAKLFTTLFAQDNHIFHHLAQKIETGDEEAISALKKLVKDPNSMNNPITLLRFCEAVMDLPARSLQVATNIKALNRLIRPPEELEQIGSPLADLGKELCLAFLGEFLDKADPEALQKDLEEGLRNFSL